MSGFNDRAARHVHSCCVSDRHFRYGAGLDGVVSRRPASSCHECQRCWHWFRGRPLARASAPLVAAGGDTPQSPFAPRANRSAARAGARAFRGVNGPLPTRDALRFSRAGPLHLLHGALAPALVRGAIGLARRKADAGQESLPRRLQRRGMHRHERLPWNWSRGGQGQERSGMREAESMVGRRTRQFLRTVVVRDETGLLPRSGVPP
jgi:hypothetical protein